MQVTSRMNTSEINLIKWYGTLKNDRPVHSYNRLTHDEMFM